MVLGPQWRGRVKFLIFYLTKKYKLQRKIYNNFLFKNHLTRKVVTCVGAPSEREDSIFCQIMSPKVMWGHNGGHIFSQEQPIQRKIFKTLLPKNKPTIKSVTLGKQREFQSCTCMQPPGVRVCNRVVRISIIVSSTDITKQITSSFYSCCICTSFVIFSMAQFYVISIQKQKSEIHFYTEQPCYKQVFYKTPVNSMLVTSQF